MKKKCPLYKNLILEGCYDENGDEGNNSALNGGLATLERENANRSIEEIVSDLVDGGVSCDHPNLLDHEHYNDDKDNTTSYWFSCIRCKEVGPYAGTKGKAKKAFREMHN